jgi:thiamine kinase-like enzyme
MSLAIAHTHRVMRTFHMDIKPGNLIVDDEENLLLIDWEQSGAPATTLAPPSGRDLGCDRAG